VVREEERISTRFKKEAISLSPLFVLKNMDCPQNKVNHKQHDHRNTTVPKETHDKVKDANNNVKKKTKNHEHDHQANDDPNPRAET
jgi:hypothetical protein